jgi:phosphoglucosamine mutase
VKTRRDLAEIPEVAKRIKDIETTLNGRGRLLVRYSGTEPKVRVMIEGEDEAAIRRHAEDLAGLIREKLG